MLIVFGGAKECYAAKNRAEYWAEGVQCWYDTNRTMDHDHNHIHTREQLKDYDPELAKLCEDVLGDADWRFVSPRERAGKGHLAGYRPGNRAGGRGPPDTSRTPPTITTTNTGRTTGSACTTSTRSNPAPPAWSESGRGRRALHLPQRGGPRPEGPRAPASRPALDFAFSRLGQGGRDTGRRGWADSCSFLADGEWPRTTTVPPVLARRDFRLAVKSSGTLNVMGGRNGTETLLDSSQTVTFTTIRQQIL